jgi:hypothetical protein
MRWAGSVGAPGRPAHLNTSGYPPAVSLGPDGDHPGRALVVADLPQVAAIVQRVAADASRLARARRVADLGAAASLTGGPDGGVAQPSRTWTSGSSAAAASYSFPAPQLERARDAGRPGNTSTARSANGPAPPATRPGHADDHPRPQRTPGPFRKLDRPDAVHDTVVTGALNRIGDHRPAKYREVPAFHIIGKLPLSLSDLAGCARLVGPRGPLASRRRPLGRRSALLAAPALGSGRTPCWPGPAPARAVQLRPAVTGAGGLYHDLAAVRGGQGVELANAWPSQLVTTAKSPGNQRPGQATETLAVSSVAAIWSALNAPGSGRVSRPRLRSLWLAEPMREGLGRSGKDSPRRDDPGGTDGRYGRTSHRDLCEV